MFDSFQIPEEERPALVRELSGHYFLADFSPEDLEILLRCAQAVDYDDGDVIFKEGDIGVHFFIILRGEVEILKEASGVVLASLGPGKVFGEMAVLDNQPRSASAVASRRVDLLAVEGRRLMEEYPHLSVKLLLNLARELSDKLRGADILLDQY